MAWRLLAAVETAKEGSRMPVPVLRTGQHEIVLDKPLDVTNLQDFSHYDETLRLARDRHYRARPAGGVDGLYTLAELDIQPADAVVLRHLDDDTEFRGRVVAVTGLEVLILVDDCAGCGECPPEWGAN